VVNAISPHASTDLLPQSHTRRISDMPLRQAKLHFGCNPAEIDANLTASISSPRQEPSRSSSASSETLPGDDDPDTIVVGGMEPRTQLPTPDESTMDAFSQSSHDIPIKRISPRKPRRVEQETNPKQQSQDCIVETIPNEKERNVSGETLVTNTSQSSLLRNGIAALDLPWSVTSLVQHGSTAAENPSRQRNESLASASEEDQLRAEKAAAKRAKIEENAKLWEARKKTAEEKAVRRSSRASMLGKAGEAVSDLTANVLGKRPREALEKGKGRLGELKRRASLRPRSMVEPLLSTTPAFERPMAKSRRLSDGDLDKTSKPTEAFNIPRKPVPIRKDKRWLKSGLYTGQTRDFDGRLSDSTNKRKHDVAPPVKENKTLPLPMFAGERIMKYGRDFKLPYDVFSPLPPGQPRPDEWRKTNKNVFVGDAAQVWRHSKPREHSTCMCTQETGCNDSCMNRFMFYECDGRNCNLADCSNRSFQSLTQRSKKGGKYNVGVEVIQTRDRGFGVRSNRTFEANQIIVEYTGEIITQDECDKRMRTLYKNNEVGPRTCFLMMSNNCLTITTVLLPDVV
jgi:[histone H3]-lysine4 N-trimethyltransferase ASH1L